MILNTRSNYILKPLRTLRLDIESEKMTNLVSLLRRMRSIARVSVHSSALKMFALFGNQTVSAEFLATTAEATRSPFFEPSVYIQWNHHNYCTTREIYFWIFLEQHPPYGSSASQSWHADDQDARVELAEKELCKVSFWLNPIACRSSCTRMPNGGIWFGLWSKADLNLQAKTVLKAGFWAMEDSFRQYCIDSFFLQM